MKVLPEEADDKQGMVNVYGAYVYMYECDIIIYILILIDE